MRSHALQCRSRLATAISDLLDPVAFGLFVAALIFDVIYANSPQAMWVKGASWLVSIGLVFAIIQGRDRGVGAGAGRLRRQQDAGPG